MKSPSARPSMPYHNFPTSYSETGPLSFSRREESLKAHHRESEGAEKVISSGPPESRWPPPQRIYVTDTLRNKIYVLSTQWDGSVMQTIGKTGTEKGEFNFPTEIVSRTGSGSRGRDEFPGTGV